jgi:hypothetical protein
MRRIVACRTGGNLNTIPRRWVPDNCSLFIWSFLLRCTYVPAETASPARRKGIGMSGDMMRFPAYFRACP